MVRTQLAFSHTYLYLLLFVLIASGLSLLLIDMTNRTYSFMPDRAQVYLLEEDL